MGLNESRQISRYEQGKIIPSIEVLLRITNALDASIDYLLMKDAPKERQSAENQENVENFLQLSELEEEDKRSLRHIVDAFLKKNKMKKNMEENI